MSSNSLITRLRRLFNADAVRRFAVHNRRVFPQTKNVAKRRPVVLFELGLLRSAHIAYSYLANVLAEEHGARIVAYAPDFARSRKEQIFFRIKQWLGVDNLAVYRSFGTSEFLAMRPTKYQRAKAESLFRSILPTLKGKKDVEDLTIEGVLVGDLIYDSYMMGFRRPTIDLGCEEFQAFLKSCIALFVAWNDYMDSNDVRAVNVSHCVYTLAFPLRIALKRGIPAFQANITHVYRLSEKRPFAYNDFFDFPRRFADLPTTVRQQGVEEADRRIRKRFAGEIGIDMGYSTKTAYGRSRHERLLRPSDRKKILIATHCFFDSPHSYGNNIFPDFFEWISFLGEISEITDYDWYIKTHPDYLPGTKEVIEGMIERYPKLTLLPADASHHQIVDEGISLALTAHGTIGFEYAEFGVPVINASVNNPHIAYGFNMHAKNPDDYKRMLLNIDALKPDMNKERIREYYFMRNIFNTNDLFFPSYQKLMDDIGGYFEQFEVGIYDRWLDVWSPEMHETIKAALLRFARSGDFRMDYRHFGREFSVETVKGRAA